MVNNSFSTAQSAFVRCFWQMGFVIRVMEILLFCRVIIKTSVGNFSFLKLPSLMGLLIFGFSQSAVQTFHSFPH